MNPRLLEFVPSNAGMRLLELPVEQLLVRLPRPPLRVEAVSECAPEPYVALALVERLYGLLLSEYPLAAHLVSQVVAFRPMG